ncbi:MAG: hypothetical protein QHJ73_09850, partial [Armatimonadota bacterium]|nr:hypothetical protein [Armatimonadota bacterium]
PLMPPHVRVADLRSTLGEIAAGAGKPPEDLLSAVREELELALESSPAPEPDPGAAVPSDFLISSELQQIVRYEAHLRRQLQSIMHEYEALQSRRRGGSAPLARLDVSGLIEE